MSPATPWTELQMAAATLWLNGVPIAGSWEDDAYIDFLFETPVGSGILFNPGTLWTELTVPSTSGTEMTVSATSWAEVTI
jgi:hypothetical protein